MSDAEEQMISTPTQRADAPPPAATADLGPQTAGAWLRAARQSRGLHIAALGAMLKVPQAKLEALEANRWQDLPDATFARALAKAMCRVLKVDAAPALAMMPRGPELTLDVSGGLNQPYREREGRDDELSFASLLKPVVWGPGLLLLGAALIYNMPESWLKASPKIVLTEPAVLPLAEPIESPVVGPSADSAAASAAGLAVAVAAAPAPGSSSATIGLVKTPIAAATAASAVPKLVAPSPVPQAAPVPTAELVPLQIKVTAKSWVKVVDARGQILLSKELSAGETQDLSVLPPLKLTVGNMAGTQINLRGQRIELTSPNNDNVARIEVN
jgi:cytoskeleton protein RodZ